MQAGEYRRALGFIPHAAGEHVDTPAGTALYAWLLQIGGQSHFARVVLEEARRRAPAEPILRQAQATLSDAWPTPSGALLDVPWRVAPYAWGAKVPQTARVLGSGVLIDRGRAALVPTRVIDGAVHLWVRNALGQTAQASIGEQLDEVPLTLLRLAEPLAPPPAFLSAAREPFGGSPAYALEYSTGAGDLAAWPLLQPGFFGSVSRDGGTRPLGISLPPGPRGGPVFDAAGQLVGVAFVDNANIDRVVFASKLRPRQGIWGTDGSTRSTLIRMPVDEVYDRGLKATVQVIVSR
jgi:S1-C subfamily serine protease